MAGHPEADYPPMMPAQTDALRRYADQHGRCYKAWDDGSDPIAFHVLAVIPGLLEDIQP